jgi:hypothetical protein
MVKERMYLDDGENGAYVEAADDDGIQICECNGESKVYIYFSEISKLVRILQEYLP